MDQNGTSYTIENGLPNPLPLTADEEGLRASFKGKKPASPLEIVISTTALDETHNGSVESDNPFATVSDNAI